MDETMLHEETLVNADVQYEASDASARWVLAFAGSLVVLGVVVFVALLWFFRFMLAREPAVTGPPPSVLAARDRGQLPPEPRLEGLVSREKLYGMPEADRGVPPKYGWVDRPRNIVSIPIEEAMEIQARRLSAKEPGPAGRTWQPEPSRPSSSNSGRTLPGGPTFLSVPGGQP
jgi:hypothetical protein